MENQVTGRIKGHIDIADIYRFITNKWDPDAVMNKVESACPLSAHSDFTIMFPSDYEHKAHLIMGTVTFCYKKEMCTLSYFYSNIEKKNDEEVRKNCQKAGIAFGTEETEIALTENQNSVEIINMLVSYFGGGWIDDSLNKNRKYHTVLESIIHTVPKEKM